MGWIIALLAAILVVLIGGVLLLSWQVGAIGTAIQHHLARLRLEIGAGLGVNVEDPNGYLNGGHLEELRDDLRDRRREAAAQRKADLERGALF